MKSPKSIGRSPSNSIVDEVLNQDTTVMFDIEEFIKNKKKPHDGSDDVY